MIMVVRCKGIGRAMQARMRYEGSHLTMWPGESVSFTLLPINGIHT